MASAALPPTCKVILAQGIAKGLLEEVKQGLTTLNKKPKVVGLLANEDPAAKMYADWSMKTCVEKYGSHISWFLASFRCSYNAESYLNLSPGCYL
jgi:5,10-methylene-tetrahydrofolate dehydrogenase/methenyl tetrahydrofolate cyclohydrolase